MYLDKTIALLIPARNEEESLSFVLQSIPPEIDLVLVVDNGSRDATASIAQQYGARVIAEDRPGYGSACLAGLAALRFAPPHIVVFADADGSDDLSRLNELVAPLAGGDADLTLTQRLPVTPDALTPQQRFGHWLTTGLIRHIWGYRFNDLGPLRAITWSALERLQMRDAGFGWTVEMQIKAVRHGLRIREYPAPYRPRLAGKSKISRTVLGSVRAGLKILWVVGREALSPANKQGRPLRGQAR
jgi:glycosyltransferase involved in cell wall biosynthesis